MPFLYFFFKAIEKLDKFKGEVYRGIPASTKDTILQHYKCGNIVYWSACSSATKKHSRYFAKHDGIIFKIQIDTGVDISKYSVLPEEEVLLTLILNLR